MLGLNEGFLFTAAKQPIVIDHTVKSSSPKLNSQTLKIAEHVH